MSRVTYDPDNHPAPPEHYPNPNGVGAIREDGTPAGEVYETSLSLGGQIGYMVAGVLLVFMPLLALMEYVFGMGSEEASWWVDYGQAFAAALVGAFVYVLIAGRVQESLIYRYSGLRPTKPIPRWRRWQRSRSATRSEETEQGAAQEEDHDLPIGVRSSGKGDNGWVPVTLYPAPGARFSPRQFALMVLTPTITALVLLPGLLFAAQVYLTEFASIGLFVMMSFTFYHPHFAVWALRQPREATIALTDDPSTVRAYHPPATPYP